MKLSDLTYSTKKKDIVHNWHLVNVEDQILGRVATQIALLLMGKAKPYFVPHLDCGDYVVVINAKKVRVTGKKETDKIYNTYSGYPGGLRKEAYRDLFTRKPEEVIRRAVYGMLPKNKLRDLMIKRLYVNPEDKHLFLDKFQNQKTKIA